MIALRILATVLAAIGLVLASLYLTLPNVASQSQLALMSMLPGGSSASARASMAEVRLAADADDPQRIASERLAVSALRQEPGNVAAIRALAGVQAARGNEDRARRLLEYGERMTRRDAPTNLALGELAIGRGDAAGAVRYLGHVVATSELYGDAAADRLMVAARDPAVARILGAALPHNPTWKRRFVPRFVRSTEAADALASTLTVWARSGLDDDDRASLAIAFRTLLKAKADDRAAALYRLLYGGSGSLVRDGGFDQRDDDPFGWQLISDSGLSALKAPGDSGRNLRLDVVADPGRAGPVADQILALPPGRYRLTATVAGGQPGSPQWPSMTLACPGDSGPRTTVSRQFASGASRRSAQEFSIPEGCPLQTLAVNFGAPFDGSRSEGWVDDVEIDRVGQSSLLRPR